MIKCSKCNEDKPEKDFYIYKNGYRRLQCRNCIRLAAAKFRSEHAEAVYQNAKKSHQRTKREHPEYFIFYRAKKRAIKYDIPFNIEQSDIKIPEYCPALGIRLYPKLGEWGE